MQNRVFMWGCAVLGAGFAFAPKPANACGCAASDAIEASKPGPGDVDVPTDVVPWVVAGGEVALIDEHGVVVPTRQERYAFGVACASPSGLIATEPLKPNA